jgi:addiction module RelE/StbE family toxin
MHVLSWDDAAKEDLMGILEYIGADNPEAAFELEQDIEAKIAPLVRFPLMYRAGREPGTREAVVRSNYIVVYSVSAKTVNIQRVLHGAQQWPKE